MTTLTLQVENPSILAKLKDMLKSLQGVKIVTTNEANFIPDDEIPNSVTLKAMKELEQGKDAGRVDMGSLESFIASMQ